MLVDTENLPESKSEAPAPAHPHLRVRSDLHEEYSSDEIAKMTELYEGTLSNIEEGEIVKSKVLRVTDTAVILDVGFKSEGAVPIDEFKDARSLKEGEALRPGEGGAGQAHPEGHREKHHRPRRLHQPRRRERAAQQQRHDLRPGVAPVRDGADRPGRRGQSARPLLGARAHQPGPEA